MGGAQFGTPMLHPKPASVPPTKFVFVVPGVHAMDSFWTAIESHQARLSTCRSVISFPLEEAGAAYQWWRDFLTKEEQRVNDMCAACCRIRSELATIVVHQQQSKDPSVKAGNTAKLQRRDFLLQELQTHTCADQGKLTVLSNHSGTLTALAAAVTSPTPRVESSERKRAEGAMPEYGKDESDSCSEFSVDEEDFMDRTVALGRLPQAHKNRGNHLRKDMIVAIVCSNAEGEHMGGQAFWLAKIVKLTAL